MNLLTSYYTMLKAYQNTPDTKLTHSGEEITNLTLTEDYLTINDSRYESYEKANENVKLVIQIHKPIDFIYLEGLKYE